MKIDYDKNRRDLTKTCLDLLQQSESITLLDKEKALQGILFALECIDVREEIDGLLQKLNVSND